MILQAKPVFCPFPFGIYFVIFSLVHSCEHFRTTEQKLSRAQGNHAFGQEACPERVQ